MLRGSQHPLARHLPSWSPREMRVGPGQCFDFAMTRQDVRSRPNRARPRVPTCPVAAPEGSVAAADRSVRGSSADVWEDRRSPVPDREAERRPAHPETARRAECRDRGALHSQVPPCRADRTVAGTSHWMAATLARRPGVCPPVPPHCFSGVAFSSAQRPARAQPVHRPPHTTAR